MFNNDDDDDDDESNGADDTEEEEDGRRGEEDENRFELSIELNAKFDDELKFDIVVISAVFLDRREGR